MGNARNVTKSSHDSLWLESAASVSPVVVQSNFTELRGGDETFTT
jgi:hypothetical protein